MAKKLKIPKKVRKEYKYTKNFIGGELLFKYSAAYVMSKCCTEIDNLLKVYQSDPENVGLIMYYLRRKLECEDKPITSDSMFARTLTTRLTEENTSKNCTTPFNDTVPGYYFKSDQKAIKAIERSEKGFIERYKRGEYNSLAADELYKALTGDENGISLKKHFELREERERKFREAEERRNNMITSDNNDDEEEE